MGTAGVEPASILDLFLCALPLSYVPYGRFKVDRKPHITEIGLSMGLALRYAAHWVRYHLLSTPLACAARETARPHPRMRHQATASLRLRVPHFGDGLPPGCYFPATAGGASHLLLSGIKDAALRSYAPVAPGSPDATVGCDTDPWLAPETLAIAV